MDTPLGRGESHSNIFTLKMYIEGMDTRNYSFYKSR